MINLDGQSCRHDMCDGLGLCIEETEWIADGVANEDDERVVAQWWTTYHHLLNTMSPETRVLHELDVTMAVAAYEIEME